MTSKIEVPKGNFVARTLRLMNENSKDLFPKTPMEKKEDKFHTIYTTDFIARPPEVFLESLSSKVRHNCD